jgi:HAD superfamily hydrolase (TIGR01490 family)
MSGGVSILLWRSNIWLGKRMKKPIIAVFDFDETLITRDTFIDFLRFSTSAARFNYLMALSLPTLILYILKVIPRHQAKQNVLTRFFKGVRDENFQSICKKYATRLDEISNPEGLKCIKRYQKNGSRVVICSASIEDWIEPWAKKYGVNDVLATKLQKKNGYLTGRLDGANCFGPEKVKRFLAENPKRESYELHSYGDGKSDAQIFQVSDKVYKKVFNES